MGLIVQPTAPLDPYIGATDPRFMVSSNVIVANRAYLSAFTVRRPVVVTTAKCEVLTAAGNIDMGIYDAAGNRLASTGSTACPAAGVASIALTAPVTLLPGVRYWAAFAGDSATCAVYFNIGSNILLLAALALTTQVGSSMPLPTPLTIPTTGTTNGRCIGVYFT